MTDTMRAAVMHAPGGPEVLRIERRPIPQPQPGEVLIRVEAFGLNRSELFTRQGHSPGVSFPRILGIEATGTVAAAPGGTFAVGDPVATVMGGMGRAFDGGYAEFVKVPQDQVPTGCWSSSARPRSPIRWPRCASPASCAWPAWSATAGASPTSRRWT